MLTPAPRLAFLPPSQASARYRLLRLLLQAASLLKLSALELRDPQLLCLAPWALLRFASVLPVARLCCSFPLLLVRLPYAQQPPLFLKQLLLKAQVPYSPQQQFPSFPLVYRCSLPSSPTLHFLLHVHLLQAQLHYLALQLLSFLNALIEDFSCSLPLQALHPSHSCYS